MSKNTMASWMSMAMGAGTGIIAYYYILLQRDRKAFQDLIRDKNITDPRDVWDICCDYHKEIKSELAQSNTRIKAGEEICRVGEGLLKVRKMMEDKSHLPTDVQQKLTIRDEDTEEDIAARMDEVVKFDTPTEVKKAIIAHWWTELMKLFVPWGIVLPEEIDDVKDPCFQLVGPEIRESILRAQVEVYKKNYQNYKEMLHKSLGDSILERERHSKLIAVYQDQVQDLLDEKRSLESRIQQLESGDLDDDA